LSVFACSISEFLAKIAAAKTLVEIQQVFAELPDANVGLIPQQQVS
jgi:hypothetical protein